MIKFDKNFILEAVEKLKIETGIVEYETTEFLLRRKAELEKALSIYPDRNDLRDELNRIITELANRGGRL